MRLEHEKAKKWPMVQIVSKSSLALQLFKNATLVTWLYTQEQGAELKIRLEQDHTSI